MTEPTNASKFSEFIRNASPEERERIYKNVMDAVAEEQAAVIAKVQPTNAGTPAAITSGLGTTKPEAVPAPTCDWRQDDWGDCESNTYNTNCGEMFSLMEGKPSDNNMRFCHSCGKPLVEHPYVEPEIEDDD